MMHHIRPFHLFSQLQNHSLSLLIPSESSALSRSVMMLETALLVAAARIHHVQTILEIGTSYGYTALHLARNTTARITTIDIAPPVVRMYKGEPEESRIEEVTLDSRHLPIRNYEMVFIDGDHTTKGISADTQLAFQCSPLVVAWHDYGNKEEPVVAPYLEGISGNRELYHVEESWLVFWFRQGLEI